MNTIPDHIIVYFREAETNELVSGAMIPSNLDEQGRGDRLFEERLIFERNFPAHKDNYEVTFQ